MRKTDLVAAAVESTNESAFTDDDLFKPDRAKLTPNAVADKIMAEHDFLNVRQYLYEYVGTHWASTDDSRLTALALQFDGKWHTQRSRRSEIASYIRDTVHRSSQDWRRLKPYEIPLHNGVVDIRSMTLRRHSADDMLQACPPTKFNPLAQCPVWMSCLDTYFGGDDDAEMKSSALQEFFGYCLMPHARYKKALLCVGESDCGKSTIPFLIREIVGRENVCSISVEDMDDSRKRAPLMGKLVNLLTELTSDAMIADGGFKTLVSTEEPIQFDPKYLPPILDIPICKHVFVTNNPPAINDRSRATFNRLLYIHFSRVIPKLEQDRTIWDKLRAEIEGIVLWALEGAARLYERGGTFTAAGETEVEDYRREQNPINAFLEDECERGDDEIHRCHLKDLRQRFSIWSGKAADSRKLATMLRQIGIEVTKTGRWVGGARGITVLGVKLK